MGADLVDTKLPPSSPKQTLRAEAERLSVVYSKKVEPGVKVSVEFSDPAPEEADAEIDFAVVIAPNTTRVRFKKGLSGFAKCEAGLYSDLKGKEGATKNPDKTIQEAHHAPPVELANSLGNALIEAGDELQDDYPDTAPVLSHAGSEFIDKATTGHGDDLPAILANEKTHRIRGGGGPRIHGSDIRTHLTKYLTKRKAKDVARTTTGEIAVKPGGAAFSRQIASVAADASKQDDLYVAFRDHGPEIVSRVYAAEESRALGAVEQALSKSEVDGSAASRRSAFSRLKTLAKSKWGALVKLVKF